MSIWSRVEHWYGIKILQTHQIQDVYRIRTANKIYCLKSYDFPEEEIRFITRIFSYMDEQGFTHGQKAYPTIENSAYITHNGISYTLTNWIYGQRPDFSIINDYKKGVRTLANFHIIAEGLPAEEAPIARIRYSGLNPLFAEYKQLLSLNTSTRHLAALCEDALVHLQQPKVLEAIDKEQRLSAFVHGDYNYPNLIKDQKRQIHLIDFDNTSLNARMIDLSHILHRNCLWNGVEMLRWIDYYHQYRQLSSADRNLLYALLVAPYHVVRNIKIGGIENAKRVIPTQSRMRKYQKELRTLL